MCLTTYDEEQHFKNVYEYARSEGIEEGRAEGLAKGLAEERIRLVGHVIQSLQLRQFSDEQIIAELQQLFPFTEEEAITLFKQYEHSK